MRKKIGNVLGKTNTREVYIVSQGLDNDFIQSEYLIIDDLKQGEITCEVLETVSYPFADDTVLPEGTNTRFIERLGYNIDDFIHIAKVRVLKSIQNPIMPTSKVYKAKYDDIKDIISKANVQDSMTIGIIKGTEFLQEQLPLELQNISPLWKEGKAVEQKGIPLMLNHHSFREYPHIGLFGSSGSGKSFAMRVLLEEMMKLNIPALCLDPHFEMKFEGTMEGLDKKNNYTKKYEEFTIGVNVGIKFEDLQFSDLTSLFEFVDALTEPQKNALEVLFEKGDTFKYLQHKINALKNAFEKMDNPKLMNKVDLQPLEAELYGKCKNKVSGAVTLQALSWKCISLENSGIFVSNIEGVKKAIKSNKLAVIRGDITRLQMISSYLIRKLYKERRNYIDKEGEYFPPFFTVVDEAHNFAPMEGRNTPTKNILRKIGQEARKYGVFLTLCTQRPKNLDATLLAQLNTKFIFRLTDQTDMQVAKVEGNLTDSQVVTLPDLPSGNCFVSSAVLNKTYPVRFRTTFSKAPNVLDPFDELKLKSKILDENFANILKEYLPIDTIKIGKLIPEIKNKTGQNIVIKDVLDCLENLVEIGEISKKQAPGTGIKYEL